MALLNQHAQGGMLGARRVNVVMLNLALDEMK